MEPRPRPDEAHDQRKLIYAAQAANLKAAVEQARLPASDRELADTLLENGTWLADNDDPLAEADRFNDVADQLLTRMDEATDRKDIPGLKRLADIYRGVADQGVEANIEEAVNAGPVVGERKKQLEQAVRSNAGRRAKLVKLLKRTPEAAPPGDPPGHRASPASVAQGEEETSVILMARPASRCAAAPARDPL